jgi:glutamate carboxypeptidase
MNQAPLNQQSMLADLRELVTCESFSADLDAVARSAELVAAQGTRLLGTAPDAIVIDGVTHLLWGRDTPVVLIVGHHDTVWPIGSLASHPWTVSDGIARGPGIFDMKAGLVQTFHALAGLPSLDGVAVLITGDEETGSLTSRALIEDLAKRSSAALVLEASADGGALKTGRKGTSGYEIVVHGRAAHSGLEPEKGINAAVEIAHQILAMEGIQVQAGAGTTVTPTLLAAGSSSNTVPAQARLSVDVRVPTVAAQQRVDELMRGLTAVVPGARLEIEGGPNRPPLDPASSARLFELARSLSPGLRGVTVGGASDGNFTAGVGCPTLDGLGAVGGGAHADDEHIVVSELVPRTRLLAALVGALL